MTRKISETWTPFAALFTLCAQTFVLLRPLYLFVCLCVSMCVSMCVCRGYVGTGLIKGLTHLLNLGASEARESAAGALWALCVERGNKRFLAQDRQLLQAISATINDVDASDKTVGFRGMPLCRSPGDFYQPVLDAQAYLRKHSLRHKRARAHQHTQTDTPNAAYNCIKCPHTAGEVCGGSATQFGDGSVGDGLHGRG